MYLSFVKEVICEPIWDAVSGEKSIPLVFYLPCGPSMMDFLSRKFFEKKNLLKKNPEGRRGVGFPDNPSLTDHTVWILEIGQKNLQDLQVQNPFLLNIKFYKVKS